MCVKSRAVASVERALQVSPPSSERTAFRLPEASRYSPRTRDGSAPCRTKTGYFPERAAPATASAAGAGQSPCSPSFAAWTALIPPAPSPNTQRGRLVRRSNQSEGSAAEVVVMV